MWAAIYPENGHQRLEYIGLNWVERLHIENWKIKYIYKLLHALEYNVIITVSVFIFQGQYIMEGLWLVNTYLIQTYTIHEKSISYIFVKF